LGFLYRRELVASLSPSVSTRRGLPTKTMRKPFLFFRSKAKAKPVLPIQDSVSVSAVATCKREADDMRDVGPTDQPVVAEVSIDTREPLSTSETVSDETVKEMRGPKYVHAKPSDEPALFTALKLRTPTAVLEVDQTLDRVELTEFGPAESPLRELATIGVLARHGITTEQVTSFDESFVHCVSRPFVFSKRVSTKRKEKR